jgi:uridylate kinase
MLHSNINYGGVSLEPKYKRIILKLSGEALGGSKGFGLDEETLISIGKQIKTITNLGVQIAVVVGGAEAAKPWTELRLIIWECLQQLLIH